jgi:hypothetical protein
MSGPVAAPPKRRGVLIGGAVLVAGGFLGAVGAGGYSWVTGLVPDGPPLTAVTDIPADGECAPVVVPASERADLEADTPIDGGWAAASGGAALSNTFAIDVTIQGTSDQAVVLQGFEVVDVRRLPYPEDAVAVSNCPPVGGSLGVRYLEVALDESAPSVVAMANDEAVEPIGDDAPVRFPFTVSSSDVEVFVVKVASGAAPAVYQWRLAVDWTSGGESGRLMLGGDDGFRTAVPGDGASAPFWQRREDGSWEEWG